MSHPIEIDSHFIEINNVNIHYLLAGKGEPVLLLHGWPTSSFLWRNIIKDLSSDYRVIAPDLAGFGQSGKKFKDSYSFNYHDRIIEGLLKHLEIDQTNLVVHDLGGPVGLYWATKHPEKVLRLGLTNTLVFPEFSWAVKLFGLATLLPGIRNWLTSPAGLRGAIRFGVFQKKKLSKEVLTNYDSYFKTPEDRKTLLKTAQRLSLKGFHSIAQKLPEFKIPITCIYGEKDRILPDVAKTMQRVQNILPQTTITSIPNCGHFLQEDEPERLSTLLKAFLQTT